MRATFILLLCFTFSLAFAQNRKLNPQQMKEDLDYLNKYLKKWHPAYYDYTRKEQMDAYYNQLKNNCSQDTFISFFAKTVRQAINKVGCGHMGIYGSVKNGKTPPLLPVNIWALNNRLFLRSSWTQDSLVKVGDEILAIDGIDAATLIQQTSELAFTDGFNKTHKMYSLQYNFSVFYYFLYGQKEKIALTIKNNLGNTSELTLNTVIPDTIKQSNAIVKDTMPYLVKSDGIRMYQTDFDASTVVLDINSFGGKKQGRTYRRAFKYLRTHKIGNLVIDLRYNGGGRVFKGNNLLTYLLDQPVIPMVISRKPNLTFINPKFKGDFFEKITPILFTLNPLQYPNKHGWNHVFPFFKKNRNHFDGKIFVLTNGGTFSMASYVASFLKNKRNAIVIGEETGGSEYGSRAMAGGHFTLPNSKLNIKLNVYQMTHALNIEDQAHGVMPDHETTYTIDDILNQRDLDMEKVKSLITKSSILP